MDKLAQNSCQKGKVIVWRSHGVISWKFEWHIIITFLLASNFHSVQYTHQKSQKEWALNLQAVFPSFAMLLWFSLLRQVAVNPSLDGLQDLLCPTTSGDYQVFKQRAFRTNGDFLDFLKSLCTCAQAVVKILFFVRCAVYCMQPPTVNHCVLWKSKHSPKYYCNYFFDG